MLGYNIDSDHLSSFSMRGPVTWSAEQMRTLSYAYPFTPMRHSPLLISFQLAQKQWFLLFSPYNANVVVLTSFLSPTRRDLKSVETGLRMRMNWFHCICNCWDENIEHRCPIGTLIRGVRVILKRFLRKISIACSLQCNTYSLMQCLRRPVMAVNI